MIARQAIAIDTSFLEKVRMDHRLAVPRIKTPKKMIDIPRSGEALLQFLRD